MAEIIRTLALDSVAFWIPFILGLVLGMGLASFIILIKSS